MSSAREQGLDDLRASDRQARALVDAIPDLIFRLGADGVYRGVKAERVADLVAPPEQLIGATLEQRLPAPVAERIMAAIARALGRGSVETVEYALQLGGEERSFEGRVTPCGEDEVLLIVRDFTDRRRQEVELARLAAELEARLAELERERDFTETVVGATPSFLLLVDEEGRVLGRNRSLSRASGYPEGEELGGYFWETFLVPEEVSRARSQFAAAVAGEATGESTFQHVTRDGERLWVEWSLTPVVDHEGRTRYILSGLDVTERTRHEAELRRSRARIVEASDAERKRLERNLHDGAQQHLVVVSQLLHLATSRLHHDPDRASELLVTALDELGSAHEELRELARGLHPAVLSTRGLGAAVRVLAARFPMPVTVEGGEDGRLPESVETAAYYVVAEALTNAAKHAKATSVAVRLARDADEAIVEVADDGVGGAGAGTGSGLRGLRDRVEALGGTLELDSPPGRGTRIRAVLPLESPH